MYSAANLVNKKEKPKTIWFSAFGIFKKLRTIVLINVFSKFRQLVCLKARFQIMLF